MSHNRYEYDGIDLGYGEEPVLSCTICGTVWTRSPKPLSGNRVRRECEKCDDRTWHAIDTRHMKPPEASAELLAREIAKMGVIGRTDRRGDIVSAWVSGQGVNLSNVVDDWELEIHEIGPIEAYGDDIAQMAPEAEAYFNAKVLGVSDDPRGYALPTHAPGRAGPIERDPEDIDAETERLCEIAGIELP